MEYVIGATIVLFVAYKLIVRSNAKQADEGRAYLNRKDVDGMQFLGRPAMSLKTPSEIAAFNYLVMRPWRETPNHFYRLLRLLDERENVGDAEARGLIDAMVRDAGCSDEFAKSCKLAPLPDRVADVAPSHFAAWSTAHKKELEAVPQMSVGYFVNMSSRLAAAAILKIRGQS